MEWNNRLREIMKEKGLNIEKLKAKIQANGHSLSRNSIGNILNGKNSPKIDTLQIIANALEVDVWKIFSTDKTKDNIHGYIEIKDQVYRINTLDDIKKIVSSIEKSNAQQKTTKSSIYQPLYNRIQNYGVRKGHRKGVEKLNRHIFKRYNVTICNKKEFSEVPNDLSRDVNLWVFRSKEDVSLAKVILEKQLNLKFNQ